MSLAATQQPQPYQQRIHKGGWRVQTSTFKPVPIVYGTQRIAGNLLWMGDRQTVTFQAGKALPGGTKLSTQTFYNESILIGLCEGPIAGIGRVWRTGSTSAVVKPANVSEFWSIILGNPGQAALSYFTTKHPGMALGYSGLAYAFRSAQPLGTTTTPPQFSWEVNGRFVVNVATNPDANPADIVDDILTNTQYAAFWPSSYVGDLTSFRNYCTANNLFLSMVLDSATKLSDVLQRIMTLCNADLRWSNGQLTVVPFGDLIVSANGETFTPNLAPVCTFTHDEFIKGKPPEISITRPADAYNQFPIEFLNRANSYDPESMTAELQDLVQLYGVRRAPVLSAHEIASPLTARMIVTTQLQRGASVRGEYTFYVPWRFFLLDPLDIVGFIDTDQGVGAGYGMCGAVGSDAGGAFVTLPIGALIKVPAAGDYLVDKSVWPQVVTAVVAPSSGSNTQTKVYVSSTAGISAGDTLAVSPLCVRINDIKEDDNGELTITAEDLGVNTPVLYGAPSQPRGSGPPGGGGTVPAPINTPVIFEPTYPLAVSELGQGEIWIAASGQLAEEANWGGCQVWFSEDGGSTYQPIGTIFGAATQGILTSTLGTGSDPDTVNTLAVDLSEMGGDLTGIAHALADKFNNLAIVENEILAFADVAAGAGPNQFNLTYLRRGIFNSGIASHAANAPFVFIGLPTQTDPALFRWKYPTRAIGETVYFKFTSINQDANEPEDISDATAYPFTITGASLAPFNYDSTMPDPTAFTATITKKGDVNLAWSFVAPHPKDFDHFEIRVGASWPAGTLVDHTKKTNYLFTDPTPGANTYWVAAINTAGLPDANPPSAVATMPTLPDVTGLTATVTHKGDVQLSWTKPGPLPAHFKAFEIRVGASWAAGTLIDHTKQGKYLITDPTAGANTYWVGVLDMSGNYDPTPPSVSITTAVTGDVTGLTATQTKKGDIKLKWTRPASFPNGFAHYEIRTGASWAIGTFLDSTKATTYVVVDPPAGAVTYWIGVLDLNGNYDTTPQSISLTTSATGDVTSLTAAQTKKGDVKLSWTKPASFPNGFAHYEIRTGASWAAGTFLDATKKTNYLITDPASGAVTYWVGVLDLNGNYDGTPPSVSLTTAATGDVTSLTAVQTKKGDIKLKWTKPASFPNGFAHYEIRTGASWAAGTPLDTTKATQYLITDPASGAVTYWVGVLDLNGNFDTTPPSVSLTTAVTNDVSGLTAVQTKKGDVKLAWTKPASFPNGFAHYEIRTGASWAAGVFLDTTKKTNYLITDPAPAAVTYWVGVLDLNGNYDATPPSVSLTTAATGDVTGLTATVTKKGDVKLAWTKPASFPNGFAHYEIRTGASWAAGVFLDTTRKNNYLISDPPTGSTTYWVGVLDLNGNYDATPQSTTINANAPADVTSLTAIVTKKGDVKLNWTKPSPMPAHFNSYEIRSGASWAAGTFVAHTKQTQYLIIDPAPGSTTYWVGVLDLAGNYDAAPPSITASPSAPGSVTSLTATVTKKRDIKLSWTPPSPLPSHFNHFEIRNGASWGAGTVIGRSKQHSFLIVDAFDLYGSTTETFFVGVLDLAGNYDVSQPSVTGSVSSGFGLSTISGTLDDITDGSTYAKPRGSGLNSGISKKSELKLWNAFTIDTTDGNRLGVPFRVSAPVTGCACVQLLNNDWEISFQAEMGGPGVSLIELFYGDGSPGNGYIFQFYANGAGTVAALHKWNGSIYTNLAVSAGTYGAGIYPVIFKRHATGDMEIYIKGTPQLQVNDTTYTPSQTYFSYQGVQPFIHNVVVRGGHADTPRQYKDGSTKRALIDLTHAHANKNLDNLPDGATYGRHRNTGLDGSGIVKKSWLKFWSGFTTDTADGNRHSPAIDTAGTAPLTTTAYIPTLTNDWEVSFNCEITDLGSTDGIQLYYLAGPSGNGYRFRCPFNGIITARLFSWNGSAFATLASSAAGSNGPGSYVIVFKRHRTGHMEIYINGQLQVQVLDTTYSPTNIYIASGNGSTPIYLSDLKVKGGHADTPYGNKDASSKLPKQHSATGWSGLVYETANGDRYRVGQRSLAPVTTVRSIQDLGNDWELNFQGNMGSGVSSIEAFFGDGTPGHGYLFQFVCSYSYAAGIYKWDGTNLTLLASGGGSYGSSLTYPLKFIRHSTGDMEVYVKSALLAKIQDTTYSPINVFLMWSDNGVGGGEAYVSDLKMKGGHTARPARHTNGSKQTIDDGLDDAAVHNVGTGTFSGTQTYNPGNGLWSTNAAPPSGVWTARAGQPSPTLCSASLTVKKTGDRVKGQATIDMQIANLNTGSQIWTQVYSDEGGGTVIYGPVKLNVAAMTNSTSLNLEKTGSSIDFSGTAGSRTYTLQIAIFNNGTFTLVATAASLILHDQKK